MGSASSANTGSGQKGGGAKPTRRDPDSYADPTSFRTDEAPVEDTAPEAEEDNTAVTYSKPGAGGGFGVAAQQDANVSYRLHFCTC